jgi:fumarylpyruvate hydrolase
MQYPAHSKDVHHEVELVVALRSGGENISVEDAAGHIFGYGVGIDMTRRDLQAQAKEKRRPWESGKTFLHASPCSELISIEQTGELNEGNIQLRVNDELRQSGNLNQMIWKVSEVISRLSELFHLQPGDLIYTGTPAGVGPIERGDRLTAIIDNVTRLDLDVAQG